MGRIGQLDWNKGLTKETDIRVRKNIERMKETMNLKEWQEKNKLELNRDNWEKIGLNKIEGSKL